ncbi:class I SAM-dependent methyltransferase [Solibacillus sp. MA9]|uniref:Class I SAM-dependent methyltransferase n=1 Tax=Solibacillus palustris TaxID=2908203 RepID=A0ABS9UDX7_9BACL|nr:class I SAM-dependent methyltransferase [Solibacillus sp. MA9]MCH7322178.1 class I SAM-dependent methyltransferase [Solibacillus sp. MA9]
MNSYERFAEVYDELMVDIPYDQYVQWITRYAPATQFKQLLDIGCGTGTLASMLHVAGYQVSGIDLSEDMLAVASARMAANGISMPLYAMSMDELDGFDNLDVAIIPIDSINYVKDEANVVETLKRIYASLRDGGQLFFDVHSLFKMDDIFLDGPFTYDDGKITYVWHTEPGEFEHSVYHQMTFFIQTEGDLFERFDEEHFQRTFAYQQYEMWLTEIGFTSIEISADWSAEAPHDESERIFIRAVK